MIPLPGRIVLLGHPVSHSLSPTFQNVALERAGLPLRYEALDVAPGDLHDTLDALTAARGAGNVTVPHKERVAAYCSRRSSMAERVGAVNTFWVEDGALVGDNTDVGGFLELLAGAAPNLSRARPVALIGAGGASAAVLVALEAEGFGEVRVHGRTPARAEALCARFPFARPMPDIDATVRGTALVVNATPVGIDDDALPIPIDILPPDAVVLDLIAQRGGTALVRTARERGHRAADGLEMLLAQGALAFERWFGVAPDRDAMRASLVR